MIYITNYLLTNLNINSQFFQRAGNHHGMYDDKNTPSQQMQTLHLKFDKWLLLQTRKEATLF